MMLWSIVAVRKGRLSYGGGRAKKNRRLVSKLVKSTGEMVKKDLLRTSFVEFIILLARVLEEKFSMILSEISKTNNREKENKQIKITNLDKKSVYALNSLNDVIIVLMIIHGIVV